MTLDLSKTNEIVGILGIDNRVRSGSLAIKHANATGNYKKLINRVEAQFMSDCDLSINWETLANAPTLFLIDEDGKIQS